MYNLEQNLPHLTSENIIFCSGGHQTVTIHPDYLIDVTLVIVHHVSRYVTRHSPVAIAALLPVIQLCLQKYNQR